MNYLGISIGGTKCITVLGREENDTTRILGCRRVETKAAGGPYEVLERLARFGDELLSEHGLTRPDAVGIACGSPLDPVAGVI